MNPVEHVVKFFRVDLWRQDSLTLTGWTAWYVKPLRLAVVAVSDFRDGLFSIRATSLVSMTLLSLVPFLAVTVSVGKVFGVHQQIKPVLGQIMEPLGEKGHELAGYMVEFVNNLAVGALGVVGLVGLFYITFSLIDEVEEALNYIWRVRRARSLARKFTDYLSVVLVGPVLVFAAFAAIGSAQRHWLVQTILNIEPLNVMVFWAPTFMPFILICIGLTFVYKFIPHTHVNVTSALVGGMTAGILWKVAGIMFASFLTGATRYSALYSGFAILILFLIWIYVGWLIVLVGAQVAYYHQHPAACMTWLRWTHNTPAFREHLALTALVHITRQYGTGAPPCQVESLANTLRVPLSMLEDIIDDCIRHGLLHRTTEPDGVTLGRPPTQMTVTDVLHLVCHRHTPFSDWRQQDADAVRTLLRRRDQAVLAALGDVTFATLADDRAALTPHEPS